jgi:[acyl-carrier-protein] S-malonyltransferase
MEDSKIPVVVNSSARTLQKAEELRDALERQLRSPVLWEQSMRAILGTGITQFVEVGPGKVLKTLLRRIDKEALVHSIDDFPELKSLKDGLITG